MAISKNWQSKINQFGTDWSLTQYIETPSATEVKNMGADAYNNLLDNIQKQYNINQTSICTCAVCGADMRHLFLIENDKGERKTVGSECIKRINEVNRQPEMKGADKLPKKVRNKVKVKETEDNIDMFLPY